MCKFRTVACCFAVAAWGVVNAAEATEGTALFAAGKELVTRNFGDAYRATRDGLEQGIAKLRAAEKAGYPDRRAIYMLLADAYNSLGWAHAQDEGERAEFAAKEKEALRSAMRVAPMDAESRYRYAVTAEDLKDREDAYREVLRVAPAHGPARFGLGSVLARVGRLDEAVRELRRAVLSFDLEEVEELGPKAVGILREGRRGRDADDLEKALRQRKQVAPSRQRHGKGRAEEGTQQRSGLGAH